MNEKKREKFIELLGCIAKSSIEKMPDIIKEIPVFGGVLSESYKVVLDAVQEFKQKKNTSDSATQEKESINKICYKAMIEEAQTAEKPKYMSCVLFPTVNGEVLEDEQKDKLDAILNLENDFGKEDAFEIVNQFMIEYMPDELNLNDDYEIGDNYFSFNLCVEKAMYDEEDEELDEEIGFTYDEEPMKKLINAINSIFGQVIFQDYII